MKLIYDFKSHLTKTSPKALKGILFFMLISGLILLSGCRLFTVVKLEKTDTTSEQEIRVFFDNSDFDAEKYVHSIWESKVLPYMLEKAVDIEEVLADFSKDTALAGQKYGIRSASEGCPWNYIVKGKGVITAVNTVSRNGTIEIKLTPSFTTVKAQIGPVFRGTSIRDSLDFIAFDDFSNQIEFAKLANTFNKRVYDDILVKIDFASFIDQQIEFTGVFTDDGSNEILLTPLTIAVDKGGK